MRELFECTPEDEDAMFNFLEEYRRGDPHDHVTPLVGNSAIDPDLVRGQLVESLWSACQIDAQDCRLLRAEGLQRKGLGGHQNLPWDVKHPQKGESLRDRLEKPFRARDVRIHGPSASFATEQVAKLWPRGRKRLRPIPMDDAVCMFQVDTNMGFPRCSSDQENLYWYYLESKRLEERGFPLDCAMDYPSIATSRAAPVGLHQWSVRRALSMYCRVVANAEKGLQKAMDRAFRSLDQFCAWTSQLRVNEVVTNLFDNAPGRVLSADYTQFDASVPEEVLSRVFSVIESWFVSEARDQVRFVAEAFMRSGLYFPGGYFHGSERRGGVPSGSVLTNQIDCYANMWALNYSAHRVGARVLRLLTQGDDALVSFSGLDSVGELSRVMLDELGMTIKPDPEKNRYEVGSACYLQMEHYENYRPNGLSVGIRPICRAFIGMTGHERRLKVGWKGHFNLYRWLQQIEPCRDHPSFDNFLLWAVEATGGWLLEALDAIIRGDKEVELACSFLSKDNGEPGKFSVHSLSRSFVIRRLCDMCGVVCPSS